jgi:CO dehydrogenase maturation factor
MKIAILGKGGSGKSTMSWLLSKYLSKVEKINTLAIDADHNMDLTSLLGINTEKVKYFKDFDLKFRQLAGMSNNDRWKKYFSKNPVLLNFPNSLELKPYIIDVNNYLNLIVLGLGDEDNMKVNKCAHGFSAPLKYMLPTFELSDNSWLVLDSVAGSDMLNYGLYFGFDVLCIVVEGHLNSIKVANQLDILADKQGLKVNFILNKYNSQNQLIKNFELEKSSKVIAKIYSDQAILDYDFDKLSTQTLESLADFVKNIKKMPKQTEPLRKLKLFENAKV